MTGPSNGSSNGNGAKVGTDTVKMGLAQMLKGGVIVSIHMEIKNKAKVRLNKMFCNRWM